jgi:CBS domain-containing protein
MRQMGLYENMMNDPVSELALRQPILVRPTDTIQTAVEKMRQQRLGCVIVVDAEEKPLGIFTESMLTRLVARQQFVPEDPIEQHMEINLPWVGLADAVVNVVDALQTRNIRFLSVLDNEGRVTALTGQKGLMEYVADHYPGQIMVQRVGVPPYSQTREGA